MKKRIITWGILTIVILLVVVVLINNKSTLEGRILKDDINAYHVTAERVIFADSYHELNFNATTEAVKDIELLSETQGRVIALHRRTGDKVSVGAIIVKTDDDLAKANYTLAQAAYEKAKMDFQRIENLYKEKNVSLDNLENARLKLKSAEAELITAKKYYDNTSITSPITGIVETNYVEIGSTVSHGTPIANIVDISRLKIIFEAAAEDIVKIHTGETLTVTSSLFPQKTFRGKIVSVGTKANPARNYTVEAEIDNKENLLRAGMYVDVNININGNEKIMVVPKAALIGSIKDPSVYVIENYKAVIKSIQVGVMFGDMIQVVSGLQERDFVITSGQNNIEEGFSVIVKSN